MRTKILDHGYMEEIEHWGSDERIIEAARMSTGKGFRSWQAYYECRNCPEVWNDYDCRSSICHQCGQSEWRLAPNGDLGLLSYLNDNRHTTPFEMAGIVIEVQAPIMVFREWHRHRTQSYNEMSARYIPLPDFNYLPTVDRCMIVNGTNKQAGTIKGAEELTNESALVWLEELADLYGHAERVYKSGLKRGIPKEIARLPVPVARYSKMRACANLLNWLRFLTLRMDVKAQLEIREYANQVGVIIAKKFPRTWNLFVEGKK